MSLEEAINNLTAAVKANTAALGAGGKGATSAAAPKATPPVAGKPAVAKPAAKPAAKAVPTDDEGIPYEGVKAKILELGAIPGTGRAAVAAILKQFGVAKGPDLTPDQHEEAITLLQEKIDELGEQA